MITYHFLPRRGQCFPCQNLIRQRLNTKMVSVCMGKGLNQLTIDHRWEGYEIHFRFSSTELKSKKKSFLTPSTNKCSNLTNGSCSSVKLTTNGGGASFAGQQSKAVTRAYRAMVKRGINRWPSQPYLALRR